MGQRSDNKWPRNLKLAIWGTVVAGAPMLVAVVYWTLALGFTADFDGISAGMTRSDVVQVLGEADAVETKFHLAQRSGYESEYERARKSGSSYYLIWNRGIDTTFTIGFDSEDKVTIKSWGHS